MTGTLQIIPAATLRAAATVVSHGGQYRLIAMFANDERLANGYFAIYAIFAGSREPAFKTIKATIKQDEPPEFPSLTPLMASAAWYEREIHDLFGLTPLGHPDLRPLVLHENWPQGVYPLRKDFTYDTPMPEGGSEYIVPPVQGEGVFEVPVGPIHAGIIEPGHFRFSQAGENIINLEAKLFFTHRGIEKAVEGLPFTMALYRAERICGACSVANTLAYVQAVEAMAGAEVPVKGQYLRVLAAELERLYNHVGDIGNLCAGLGFAPVVSHGSRLKEQLMRLNERLTGNRFLRGWVALGGVGMDITSVMVKDIQQTLAGLTKDFSGVLDLLRNNDSFLDRVNTTGILPYQAAVDLGVVGVAARASGIDSDVRRDFPYAAYQDFRFSVPVYTSCDVAARLWVRADEAAESAKIVSQVLDSLPSGKFKGDLPPVKPYSTAFSMTESPRGSSLHWLMAGESGKIYRYFVRSASYPNWPALTVAAPGNIIPDFPLVNKSFELCYACLDR
ncbi:NADH-quinone oxidoreductase subunit C [Sporomusa malonica]|uniref:Ni,Fe-hydrogenase III large subunit n=1 Tax=Sporomusa malonica TaxID=112901 RepID=A0A1W2CBA4_9FIRM|nr:NADH-quinone oxidoreductase subunit C [Sporomusa malonica]SMC82473.1 Ni,Fe-hydrogenase III large subunit [Sporomusa malonica]